jgi:Fur family transcriptional regulator, ferric uptake regulator
MSCLKTLKEHNLKLTPQRRMIVEILHEQNTHITAEEMIARVQDRMPGVNKSTIYRTLDLLEGAGCVYKSEVSGQSVYHHAEEGHHHHLICTRCGRTVECRDDLFAVIEKAISENYGFSVSLHHLMIEGICDSCRR